MRDIKNTNYGDELVWEMLDQACDGVWSWDVVEDRVRWSDSLFNALGYPRSSADSYPTAERTVEDIFALTHPDDTELHRRAVNEHLAADSSYEVEVRIRSQDGSYTWFSVRGVSKRDADGKVLVMLGFLRDISAEMKERKDRLVAEAQFHAFADACPAGVFVKDAQGRHLYVNAAAATLAGSTPEAMTGALVGDIFPAETAEQLARIDRAVMESKEIWEWTGWVERADGSKRWVHDVKFPIDSRDGHAALGGFGFDTTELKEAELRDARAKRLSSLGELAGGIAHDFNNLIMAMRSFTDLAATALPDQDKARAYLQQGNDAMDRAQALVRSLMGFARRQPAEPVVLDVGAHIGESLPLLARIAGRQLKLRFSDFAVGKKIRLDPVQLDQILTNLIGNARDALAEVKRQGEVKIKTSFITDDRGESLLLTIEDDGPGIPAELVAQIFEPFYSTKHENRGTGLGLATVHGIVTQNKGSIEVKCPASGGTVFSIRFPQVAS